MTSNESLLPETADQLIETWSRFAITHESNSKSHQSSKDFDRVVLPTSLELYQLGRINKSLRSAALEESYRQVVSVMSESDCRVVFQDLWEALIELATATLALRNNKTESASLTNDHYRDWQEAIGVVSLLFRASTVAAKSIAELWTVKEMNVVVAVCTAAAETAEHDVPHPNSSIADETTDLTNHINPASKQTQNDDLLSLLSSVLWATADKCTSVSSREQQESNSSVNLRQKIISTIHMLQGEQEDQEGNSETARPIIPVIWNALLDWNDDHQDVNWRHDLVLEHLTEPDSIERDYLSSLLLTNRPARDETIPLLLRPDEETNEKKAATQSKSTRLRPHDEIQHRIDQVKQVVSVSPTLGDGFVEAVLAYYQGNVEQTISVLLDDTESNGTGQSSLPVALQLLDRSLPRRHGNATKTRQQEEQEEQEVRLATKEALRAANDQAEDDAYVIDMVMRGSKKATNWDSYDDEYNDDYDDQYDDMDGGLGSGKDSGLYDYDYDAIRTYNRFARQAEDENKFWQENRNTNREQKVVAAPKEGTGDGTTESDNEVTQTPIKQYRGPDKIKGGRIPRENRDGGGGRGRGENTGSVATAADKGGNSGTGANQRNGDGRGKGGRTGGGRGNAAKPSSAKNDPSASTESNTNASQRSNTKRKERVLARRRDKQKQAAVKKS